MEVINGKTILLTGGTGTFSNILAKIAREEHEPTVIRVFSRGELLQIEMERRFKDARRLLISSGNVLKGE